MSVSVPAHHNKLQQLQKNSPLGKQRFLLRWGSHYWFPVKRQFKAYTVHHFFCHGRPCYLSQHGSVPLSVSVSQDSEPVFTKAAHHVWGKQLSLSQEVFKLHQLQLSTGCPSMLVHSCWLLTACYSMSHEPINLLQLARLRITIDFFLFIHHLERFWYGQNTILLKFSLNCWFWQYSFWYFKGPENSFYPQVSMSFVPSRRTEALFQEQFKLT